MTSWTYGGDNLIQVLLFFTIHGQLTAFSYSILFFQHPLEIDFGTSVALNKAEEKSSIRTVIAVFCVSDLEASEFRDFAMVADGQEYFICLIVI